MIRLFQMFVPMLVLLAGCQSMDCTAQKPYQSARTIPELVVPEGLDMPPPSEVPPERRGPRADSPCLELPPGMRDRKAADDEGERDEEIIEDPVDEESPDE